MEKSLNLVHGQPILKILIPAFLVGIITSGFPFCKTIMADAFPKIPILVGTWAEDQREDPRDIDSAFLL